MHIHVFALKKSVISHKMNIQTDVKAACVAVFISLFDTQIITTMNNTKNTLHPVDVICFVISVIITLMNMKYKETWTNANCYVCIQVKQYVIKFVKI